MKSAGEDTSSEVSYDDLRRCMTLYDASLIFFSLVFWDFPACFLVKDFLAFYNVIPFFPKRF